MARGINPLEKFKNIGPITVPYGGETTQESFHPGIDIAGVIGTPIPVPVEGVITKTDGGHIKGENNFGNTVEMKDGVGNIHSFHHLNKINVRPGQQVQEGQQIATLGNTGATYSPSGKGDGANLDYRIVTAYGQYKNPLTYLKKL